MPFTYSFSSVTRQMPTLPSRSQLNPSFDRFGCETIAMTMIFMRWFLFLHRLYSSLAGGSSFLWYVYFSW